MVAPREIKRDYIKIVGNLGKGNFGTVDKGLLHEVQLGIPEYLVAVKQLLSKRNEERLTLLEEAATMAQFKHKHLVALIGVVTVGDPLMVSCEYVNVNVHESTKGKGGVCKNVSVPLCVFMFHVRSLSLEYSFLFAKKVILEYCEHGALDSYLKKADVSESQKIVIAGDCAEGELGEVVT